MSIVLCKLVPVQHRFEVPLPSKSGYCQCAGCGACQRGVPVRLRIDWSGRPAATLCDSRGGAASRDRYVRVYFAPFCASVPCRHFGYTICGGAAVQEEVACKVEVFGTRFPWMLKVQFWNGVA